MKVRIVVAGVVLLSSMSFAMAAGNNDMSGTTTPPERVGQGKSAGESIDDATITAKVKSAFVRDDRVSAMDVKVKTYRGVVQLSGFVDSSDLAARAEEIAGSVGGVKEVKNDLKVKK